ncbi:MAG: hypothetical protein AB1324_06945 [Candidatus Micrarchaeota archaeon]
MLRHTESIRRVELNHPRFASRHELPPLLEGLRKEKERLRASRAVLRVLTDQAIERHGFRVEAEIPTRSGILAFFGLNDASRTPTEAVLHEETRYLSRVLCSQRRPIPEGLDIVRLGTGFAEELSQLYIGTYSFYPMILDEGTVSGLLGEYPAFGVVQDGKLVSALFGIPLNFGPLTAVEYTLSATIPSARGVGLTSALALKIREDAEEKFRDPLMLAETVAAPVMHSCHDIGMSVRGVLREHYKIGIGERTYTNFYVWSL